AGEAADPVSCRRVVTSPTPPALLVNAYGPTESAVYASWYPIKEVADDAFRVPIGRPISNTTLHVLDRHGRQGPVGCTGELFSGGDGLAVGYFGDPSLTERKFVPDPFSHAPHRMYATGDLVVRDQAGDLTFLRRIDSQVKIRGFRVEPIEIE